MPHKKYGELSPKGYEDSYDLGKFIGNRYFNGTDILNELLKTKFYSDDRDETKQLEAFLLGFLSEHMISLGYEIINKSDVRGLENILSHSQNRSNGVMCNDNGQRLFQEQDDINMKTYYKNLLLFMVGLKRIVINNRFLYDKNFWNSLMSRHKYINRTSTLSGKNVSKIRMENQWQREQRKVFEGKIENKELLNITFLRSTLQQLGFVSEALNDSLEFLKILPNISDSISAIIENELPLPS
ncbi:unnamed protein product [Gordionus sp. m RMFG-2023]